MLPTDLRPPPQRFPWTNDNAGHSHPVLAGRVCAITGPTQGIGRATALALGALGAHLLLLCRDMEKGQVLAEELFAQGATARVLHTDLASLGSVWNTARLIADSEPLLDLLINNAGTITPHRRITIDGLEEMFAVNHLSHFLLTTQLLPLLQRSQDARVIHVSSGAHALLPAFDFDDIHWHQRKFSTARAYAQSKLAGLLFNRALAARLTSSSVTTHALDPGIVATNIGAINGPMRWLGKILRPLMLTPAQGAQTTLYLAVSPEVRRTQGQYWVKQRPETPKPCAIRDTDAARLWQVSQQLLAERNFWA